MVRATDALSGPGSSRYLSERPRRCRTGLLFCLHDDELAPDELVTAPYWDEQTREDGMLAAVFDPAHYMRALTDQDAAELASAVRANWGGAALYGEGDAELFQKILPHSYWKPVGVNERNTIADLLHQRFCSGHEVIDLTYS